MRKLIFAVAGLLVLGICLAPAAHAQSGPNQDVVLNLNGSTYCTVTVTCGTQAGSADGNGNAILTGITGVTFSLNSSGLGTIQVVYNPGASGTYFVNLWVFDPAGVPGYNNYGVVNGSAGSGESYQIDVPDYDTAGGIDSNHPNTNIIANTMADTLSNSNNVPGTADASLGCNTGSDCNDWVSAAIGQSFTLTSSQEEVLTYTLGSSSPGGFSLESIQPVDPQNASQTEVYFSESAVTQPNSAPPPPPPGVPEPGTLSLLAIGVVGGLLLKSLR